MASLPLPTLPTLALPSFSRSTAQTPARSLQHVNPAARFSPAGGMGAAASRTPHTIARPTAARPAARRGFSCDVCGSSSLRENALGYWICAECGAQSAERVALTQEVEEEVYANMHNIMRTGTLSAARIRRPSAKKLKLTDEEMDLVRSATLLHSFSALLQLQCRFLVLEVGLPPPLLGLVGRLWLAYVAHWREASSQSTASANEAWGATHRRIVVQAHMPGRHYSYARLRQQQQKSAAAAHGDDSDDDSSEQAMDEEEKREESEEAGGSTARVKRARSSDDEEDSDQRRVKQRPLSPGADPDASFSASDAAASLDTFQLESASLVPSTESTLPPSSASSSSSSASKKRINLAPGQLSMTLSIALLYLGCHVLREAVTMQQLCSWVHLGRLPYFNVRGLPAALLRRIRADAQLTSFFHPQSLPAASRLQTLARHAASAVVGHMERAAHDPAAGFGDPSERALAMHQAAQLRAFVSRTSASGTAAAAALASSLPGADSIRSSLAASSLSNASLLVRGWLSELHLPAQLHPLIMELVMQLNLLAPASRAAASSSDQATPTAPDASPTMDVDQQSLRLMSALVLAVQMADSTSSNEESSAPGSASGGSATLSSSPAGSALASLLGVGSDEASLVRWMREVVLARMQAPADFDLVSSCIEQWASMPPPGQSTQQQSVGERARGGRDAAQARASSPVLARLLSSRSDSASPSPSASGDDAAASSPSPTPAGVVYRYSATRRGYFHPAYASLLQRAARIVGVDTGKMQHAVHATLERATESAQRKQSRKRR